MKKASSKIIKRNQILRSLERQKRPKKQKQLRKKIYLQSVPKITSKAQAVKIAKALDEFCKNGC